MDELNIFVLQNAINHSDRNYAFFKFLLSLFLKNVQISIAYILFCLAIYRLIKIIRIDVLFLNKSRKSRVVVAVLVLVDQESLFETMIALVRLALEEIDERDAKALVEHGVHDRIDARGQVAEPGDYCEQIRSDKVTLDRGVTERRCQIDQKERSPEENE